jgi:hypothetical protein
MLTAQRKLSTERYLNILHYKNDKKFDLSQKWYQKASVQSALINSIPNLGILAISIITIVITLSISRNERSQSQANFDLQMLKDSLLNAQQDSITKQQVLLANLQLEIANRQFKNDSIDNLKQLLISKREFDLNTKKKIELDLMNSENLSIKGISFLTYETKYQEGFLDSVYGFKPDIIFKMNGHYTVNKKFELLYRLALYNFKSDSAILNIPVLQTLKDAQHYIKSNNISKDFIIVKEFTIICKIENKTQFPIKLIYDTISKINLPNSHNSNLTPGNSNRNTSASSYRNNDLLIYPGDKAALSMPFMSTLDVQLNQEFSVNIFLDYNTIFGRKSKTIKSYFSPDDKTFVIYD